MGIESRQVDVVTAENVGVSFQPGQTSASRRETATGSWVLQDLSFQISSGEFVAIVGPSGCGKTTLLRILAGLIEPTAGVLNLDEATTRRSYVFQESNLLPWRTALDNVILPLELQGQRKAETRDLGFATLAATGLNRDDAVKFPRHLSGGMRMRVSLARALVNTPQLLLLDEPFAAVDDLTRQRLNQELLSLWESSAWTAVLVTHNLAEAVCLSDRVWLLTGNADSPLEEFSNESYRSLQRGAFSAQWKTTPEFHGQVDRLSARLQATAEEASI